MRYSIIVPTLNEASGIQPCLQALQVLRGKAEIIVVDGGSHDDTVKLASPLADQIVLSDTGRAKQMNQAALVANGDLLIFLHADTFLPANALTLIEQSLSNTQTWGCFRLRLAGKPWLLKVISVMVNLRTRLTGIVTGDQTLFIRRQTFFSVGCYPEIALMEDIALSNQLNRFSRPCCVPGYVTSSGRRWEQNGVCKTILLMWTLRARYALGTNPEKLAQLYQNTRCQ